MKVSDVFPSRFLKAEDLEGREVRCLVDTVKIEDVSSNGGDRKPVLYFQGKERGLVLNITNAQVIKGGYGDQMDDWAGKPVTLYPTETPFQGKLVPCIRVRIPSEDVENELPF